MPKQLRRVLTLLLCFALIFIVLRHFLVPKSFGKYGHYRADALIENASFTPKYVGNENCVDCHDDNAAALANGPHKNLHCETCHGPGYKHVESNDAKDIILPSGRDFCGKCHDKNTARPKDVIKQVDIKSHNIEESECFNCHNPHDPWN